MVDLLKGNTNKMDTASMLEAGMESMRIEEMIARARAEGHVVPPRPDIVTILELITPDHARWLKGRMGPNRGINETHVVMLVRAMVEGRFVATNQGLGIDGAGQIVDGQHRIEAIIRSDKPQWLNVTYGLSPEAVKAIDNNRLRTFANDLEMAGEENSNNKAAATRLVAKAEMAWDKDYSLSSFSNLKFDRMELEDWFDVINSTVDLSESLRSAWPLYRKTSGGPGIVQSAGAAFYYLASAYHEENYVRQFIEKAGDGIGLEKGDPELALRNRVASLQASSRQVSNIEYLAYLIQAYNRSVAGVKLSRLDLPKSGKMPRIVGWSK